MLFQYHYNLFHHLRPHFFFERGWEEYARHSGERLKIILCVYFTEQINEVKLMLIRFLSRVESSV